MNSQAVETLSTQGVVVLCIALGVVFAICTLGVFFTVLSRLTGGDAKPDAVAVRSVLKDDTWATVHAGRGKVFERVRFVGFTGADGVAGQPPYGLSGMVILEEPNGRRVIVRGKEVRMIVVDPPASGRAPR